MAGVVATEEWKSNASARWFSLELEAAWEQAVHLLEDMADTVEIDAEAWTATALVNPHQYKSHRDPHRGLAGQHGRPHLRALGSAGVRRPGSRATPSASRRSTGVVPSAV